VDAQVGLRVAAVVLAAAGLSLMRLACDGPYASGAVVPRVATRASLRSRGVASGARMPGRTLRLARAILGHALGADRAQAVAGVARSEGPGGRLRRPEDPSIG
jgi:hypothetical protein